MIVNFPLAERRAAPGGVVVLELLRKPRSPKPLRVLLLQRLLARGRRRLRCLRDEVVQPIHRPRAGNHCCGGAHALLSCW